MKRSITPGKEIVLKSANFQRSRALNFSKSPISSRNSLRKSDYFERFVNQTQSEIFNKRLQSGRRPTTGMSQRVNDLRSNSITPILPDSDELSLHPRVLENWINSALADSEELEIPGILVKPADRLPLYRYGCDRSSLKYYGLDDQEINRILRTLFVYSIGFYQLLGAQLQNVDQKGVVLTKIWKVYAILLEYCCQVDFELIVETLNLKRIEELDQLKKNFDVKLNSYINRESQLTKDLKQLGAQLHEAKIGLETEAFKRQEMEKELQMRGGGHEDEIQLRLLFEGKLNRLFAQYRSLETSHKQLQDRFKELQVVISNKNKEISQFEDINDQHIQKIRELQLNYKFSTEKEQEAISQNQSLNVRLQELYKRIELLKSQITDIKQQHSSSLNLIAQLQIDKDALFYQYNSQKEVNQKQEQVINQLQEERKINHIRLGELEDVYTDEYENHRYFEQEYIKLRESEQFYAQESQRFKLEMQKWEITAQEAEKERDLMKITSNKDKQTIEELQSQLKSAVDKIDKLTKVRRNLEERYDDLSYNAKFQEKELKEMSEQNQEQKLNIENLRLQIHELEKQVGSYEIKYESDKKQYQVFRETMSAKFDAVTEQSSKDKNSRNKWQEKFKQTDMARQQLAIELETLKKELQEKKYQIEVARQKVNLSIDKEKDTQKRYEKILQENHKLKNNIKDLQRQVDTIQEILSKTDVKLAQKGEDVAKISGYYLNQANERVRNENLAYEELYSRMALLYKRFELSQKECREKDELIAQQQQTIENLTYIKELFDHELEQTKMLKEELYSDLVSTFDTNQILHQELEQTKSQLTKVIKERDIIKQKIPRELTHLEQPCRFLQKRISDLETNIQNYKQNNRFSIVDFSTQFEFYIETTTQEVQTDAELYQIPQKDRESSISHISISESSFSQQSSMKNLSNTQKTDHHRKRRVIKTPNTSKNSTMNQLNSSDQFTTMLNARKQSLPHSTNLKSIYNLETSKRPQSQMQTGVRSQTVQQQRPPTAMQGNNDIRRYIRQANSRRNNNYSFL